MLLPAMLNPRRLVSLSALRVTDLVVVAALWTALLVGTWRAVRTTQGFRLLKGKLGYLVLLAAAPCVALLLLIADPRYWIGVVPLLYAGVAVALEALWLGLPRTPLRNALAAALCCALFWPMPWQRQDNKPALLAARAALVERSHPTIAAVFAVPWLAYARLGRAEGRDVLDPRVGFDWNAFDIDLLVVDPVLRQSAAFKDNAQLRAKLASPAFARVFADDRFELYVSTAQSTSSSQHARGAR